MSVISGDASERSSVRELSDASERSSVRELSESGCFTGTEPTPVGAATAVDPGTAPGDLDGVRALERAADPRDRMIAVFGHDLRGLLNALAVNAELLLLRQGDAAADSARTVRLTIARMDRLIGSLLDYTRLGAGKLEIRPRAIDATPLLRETVEIFRPLAESKSLGLTLAVPEAPLAVTADPERIVQVLSNLLSNAIAFSSVRGRISIEGTISGEDVQVSVADDGPGIPVCDLDRVFESFYQVQASGSGGLGLGLYIAREIVHAHGGELWVTSQPGVGSTFYVRIPGGSPERGRARRSTDWPAMPDRGRN